LLAERRSAEPLCSAATGFCHAPLLMVGSQHITGGSLLLQAQRPPSGLPCCCQHLPRLQRLSRWDREGFSGFRARPFLACCRPYPAGSGYGISQTSVSTTAFASTPVARLPELFVYEACTTFATCGLQGRYLSYPQVCQKAPSPAFA